MTSREFALEVVRKIQASGHQALWAGGCVRDQLLGREPKDYDVATAALPEQIRELFGYKRTLAIGASFGVITVLGPKSAGPIEVATFRKDGGYSDGRRPDSVEFCNAREDAIRRDFTINGMFFDPTSESVIDYVGGQEDLAGKVIRAIGDPNARFEEDKLRTLRAVRFASVLGFSIEPETMAAIRRFAPQIDAVSGERIGAELRRMLGGATKASAFQMLCESGLLDQIAPDALTHQARINETTERLARLDSDEFATAVALIASPRNEPGVVDELFRRWKLSNDEKNAMLWMLVNQQSLLDARSLPWSQVQPLMVSPHVSEALKLLEALGGHEEVVAFCREKLSLPENEIDPPPFLDGRDLRRLGMKPGPQFGVLLKQVRAAQLDKKIASRDEAIEFVRAQSVSTPFELQE